MSRLNLERGPVQDVEWQAPFRHAAGIPPRSSLQPCLAGLPPRRPASAQLSGKPGLVFPPRRLDPAIRGEGGLRDVPKACRGGGGAGRGRGGGRGAGAAGSRGAGWRRARAGHSLPPASSASSLTPRWGPIDRFQAPQGQGRWRAPGVDHGGEIPGE